MKPWFKRWMPGASETSPYHRVWDRFRDLAQARRFIYNVEDEAAFDAGGRLDADLLRSYLTPGMDVLDVGCGIGRVEKFLASDCGTLTGVDISGHMIREARRRLADHANVRFRTNNGRDLDLFPDSSFDLAFSFFVLQHIEKEDAFRYLREIARVLRHGATAILQFPLLASRYFEDSFLTDVAGGAPYNIARPRLYTASDAVFLLSKAGLVPVDMILRGDESIFILRAIPPDRESLHAVFRMPDPTHARLYPHFLPHPPDGDPIAGLPNFRAAAEQAATTQPGASVNVDPDGSLALSSTGEFVVPVDTENARNTVLKIKLQIVEPWDNGQFPDLSIGIRSACTGDGISGPYVQTDSGNAFTMRSRNGEVWDNLPVCQFAPLTLSPGTLELSLVADESILAFYNGDAIVCTALIPTALGNCYLRIVATTVRLKGFSIEHLSLT